MSQVRVALVCPHDQLRMAAARAFDAAPSDWDVTLHPSAPAEADVLVAVGCEVAGAIAFDVTRPDLVVEDIKASLATTDHTVVAVVGASGGCGATSVALHLAASAPGGGSCLVAPGSGATALAHRLGLEPETVTPTPLPAPGGFKIATAGDAEVFPILSGLLERFPSIVVDTERSVFPSVADSSHACVLVLSPTVPSARAASELLAQFPDLRWAVVTNRLGPGGETGTAQLQRILGRRITLELPCSRGLRDAEDEGRLVSAWSPWRRRVERLARALELR